MNRKEVVKWAKELATETDKEMLRGD